MPNKARNKQRGAQDERDVAKRINGKRFPADTGGPLDVEHDWLAVQVKGGLQVVTTTLREAVDTARAGAPKTKLPCAILVDRKPSRNRRYIVMDLDDFCEWNGLQPLDED